MKALADLQFVVVTLTVAATAFESHDKSMRVEKQPLSVGGNVGLMGVIASTVYAGLGEENVIGVIPEALQPREVLLHSITTQSLPRHI